MLTQEITTKKVNLIYKDTTRLKRFLYDPTGLRKKLEVLLGVIQDFLMSSKSGCLNLGHFGVSHIEVDVTLCGSYKIKSLNSTYRNKLKVTDVLSFPVYETLRIESESFFEVKSFHYATSLSSSNNSYCFLVSALILLNNSIGTSIRLKPSIRLFVNV